MIHKIFSVFLFFAILLQASVTTFPITLMVVVILYCFYKAEWVFFVAFAIGIFLDLLLVRPVGVTSIFFLSFLFLIFLYQRKFEIASNYFVFFAIFIGVALYGVLFGYMYGLFMALLSGILGSMTFGFLKQTKEYKSQDTSLRWK